MSYLPKHMPHQAIKFDALEHLNIGSKPVWAANLCEASRSQVDDFFKAK